jgi:hypothetical protein
MKSKDLSDSFAKYSAGINSAFRIERGFYPHDFEVLDRFFGWLPIWQNGKHTATASIKNFIIDLKHTGWSIQLFVRYSFDSDSACQLVCTSTISMKQNFLFSLHKKDLFFTDKRVVDRRLPTRLTALFLPSILNEWLTTAPKVTYAVNLPVNMRSKGFAADSTLASLAEQFVNSAALDELNKKVKLESLDIGQVNWRFGSNLPVLQLVVTIDSDAVDDLSTCAKYMKSALDELVQLQLIENES